MITPHVRFSYHTHHDNKNPWLEDIPTHRVKKDGYSWWPVRIHPIDAVKRDIRDGEIVKVFNDRGAVLGIARSPSVLARAPYTLIRPAPSTTHWNRARLAASIKAGV